MQRHHTGSGRRRVIPDDWSAHHRPVANSTHGATVTLRRPGGTPGEFDPETGTYATEPYAPYFTGPARVQVLSVGTAEQLAAEQQVSTLGYAVMLDHAVDDMQLTDLVAVTAVDGNGDPWLVGRVLTVASIEGGSLHWERRLVCTDNLETQEA